MARRTMRRGSGVVAALLGASLVLSACGGDDEADGEAGGGTGAEGGGEATGGVTDDFCAEFDEYGDLEGTEVSVYTTIVAPEDEQHIRSYEPFEECTGVTVNYEGSREFEAQLPVRIEAGNPPDIAYIPQPGLLATIVEEFPDAVSPAPAGVVENVEENFDPAWREYGSVEDVFYAAPLGSNVKSFVWYSPSMFEENGWEIPTTWDEMMELTDTIAAAGITPWCAGIASGDATGWPMTDWLEDTILRTAGPEFYDQWRNHEVPFDDPQVVEALDQVGEILKNPEYVNGGFGDVQSIAATSFQDAGIPILSGDCAMYRMASFYAANYADAGAEIGEDGDVYAFYLPSMNEDERPVLVAGEFVAAFNERPEVQAFLDYLSTDVWANEKAAVSNGWVSANRNVNIENFQNPIDRLSVEILQDPNAVTRFDASDLMPGAVNTAFWRQMTDWITGKSTEEALTAIENSWP